MTLEEGLTGPGGSIFTEDFKPFSIDTVVTLSCIPNPSLKVNIFLKLGTLKETKTHWVIMDPFHFCLVSYQADHVSYFILSYSEFD